MNYNTSSCLICEGMKPIPLPPHAEGDVPARPDFTLPPVSEPRIVKV